MAAVVLVDDHHGVVGRSVGSLAALPADLPRAALVGGLAVMVRLQEAHRVTTDFDEVTDEREATIAVLLEEGAERTPNGVRFVERGVRLDLLDAGIDLADLQGLADRRGLAGSVDDDLERAAVQLAFVNRYALETAEPTRILVCADRTGERVVAEVSLPVGRAGALVAMKVHAAGQRDRRPDKAASDSYDAYRLIRAWGPSAVAADLSRAPVAMLAGTIEQVRRLFVDDVERTVRRLRSASVPGVESVDLDDLLEAGSVVDALTPFLHWDG